MTIIRKENEGQAPPDWGVYTLANDTVGEWFEGFIRSLRKTNPTAPLTVIPYNKSLSHLQRLQEEFNFTIMDESECSPFDVLESIVMGQGLRAATFRKWACFFGHYPEFIFLDADIALTSPLPEIMRAFAASPYDIVYFDPDEASVYTPDAVPVMKATYDSVGYNSGAFISRKGVMGREELMRLAQRAAGDRDKFMLNQADQPFISYAFAVAEKRRTTIDVLMPKYAPATFAVTPFTFDRAREQAICGDGRPMMFIHWPGCYYPTMMKPGIFLWFRTLGLPALARMQYTLLFYFRRYRVYFLKEVAHIRKISFQFFTSGAWRKFYLCKLVGIKIETPV